MHLRRDPSAGCHVHRDLTMRAPLLNYAGAVTVSNPHGAPKRLRGRSLKSKILASPLNVETVP